MASSYSYSNSHTPASPSQVSPHSQSQFQSKEHNEPSIESIESQPPSIESIESTQQPIESQSAVVASTADTPNPNSNPNANPNSNSNPNALTTPPTGASTAASGVRGRRRVRRRCSVSAQSGLSDLLQQYALVLYIQMAYCGRTTLENYLKDPTRVVRQRELLDVCMQLCHALTYIHGKNVIHRDVKPANIFYGEDKVVRLGDFGLSRIINDANPVSTKAAIDLLCLARGRKVAVLGDMFELGEREEELHAQVGRYAAQRGVDCLLCAGSLSCQTARGAQEAGLEQVFSFESRDELQKALPDLLLPGDSVLVKASHSMGFEKIVEMLLERK